MDKEDMIDIVYLDCPKAFDKVPHPRFFKELNCHRIGRKSPHMDKHLAERQETGYEYKTQVFRMEKDHQ